MSERTRSAVGSLKEIVVILTGLTITYAITIVVKDMTNPVGVFDKTIHASLFVFLVLNIVRFYHGNMRLLDDEYIASKPQGSPRVTRNLALDFFTVMLTSISFAVMGTFVSDPWRFFNALLFILVIDVFWALVYIVTPNLEHLKIQRRWLINNILYAFVIIVFNLVLEEEFHSIFLSTCVLMLAGLVSTMYDYYCSWEFYFPGAEK
jgi:hypothetical protein